MNIHHLHLALADAWQLDVPHPSYGKYFLMLILFLIGRAIFGGGTKKTSSTPDQPVSARIPKTLTVDQAGDIARRDNEALRAPEAVRTMESAEELASNVTVRLQHLADLQSQGLISTETYEARRQQILQEL